ncbi:50S ribosomal protein L6 [candidate division WOR-3 bacterium]|nr:50S ribosomal protein L6 [candidate division WOR-3 bacterium]
MASTYRPIPLSTGTDVQVESGAVVVKGKLGSLRLDLPAGIRVRVVDKSVVVEAEVAPDRSRVGTVRAHLRNMMVGVQTGYQKVVELRGMGYRAQKTKDGLQVTCGYSHPVTIAAPAGIAFEVAQVPNPDDTKEQMFTMTVSGTDKHLVGHTAAVIRATKPPDIYQGKGFRYRGERVRKKAGKRAVATQT